MTRKMLECQNCQWFSEMSEDEELLHSEYQLHHWFRHAALPVLWEEGIDFDENGEYL